MCVLTGEHAKSCRHTYTLAHDRRQTATQRNAKKTGKIAKKRNENRRSKIETNCEVEATATAAAAGTMSACHDEHVCSCLYVNVCVCVCACVRGLHELQLLLKAFACHSFALCAPVLALSTRPRCYNVPFSFSFSSFSPFTLPLARL